MSFRREGLTVEARIQQIEEALRQLRRVIPISGSPTGQGAGVTDHGALNGLADNDHPQYVLTAAHTGAAHDLLGLDHGALAGLGDDDHTQYVLKSLVDAKGDLVTATADDTPARLPVGSDGLFLKADSATATGLTWAGVSSGSGSGTSHAQSVGDGMATSFVVNHALNTRDVLVYVYEAGSPFARVFPDVTHTDADNVTVSFVNPPASNEYRVIVLSAGVGSILTITQIDDTDSPYTALLTDEFIEADATNGVITVNLPTAVGNSGKRYWIKKIDSSSNAVTVDGDGTETIDDATTFTLSSQYDTLAVVSNNAEWWIT